MEAVPPPCGVSGRVASIKSEPLDFLATGALDPDDDHDRCDVITTTTITGINSPVTIKEEIKTEEECVVAKVKREREYCASNAEKEEEYEREHKRPRQEEDDDGAPLPFKKKKEEEMSPPMLAPVPAVITASKKKREREPGSEDKKRIDELHTQISRIETEIKENAAKYEQCRHILSLGVASLEAIEQTNRMRELIKLLRQKKAERSEAINKHEAHLFGLSQGTPEDVLLEEVRETRAKRRRLFPMDKTADTEEQEVAKRVIKAELRRTNVINRTNAANCPNQCKHLEEDVRECIVYCPDCGTVYENIHCNSENPLCTAGKFGEQIDVPRRRSGGYKPPTHFAEIIGHFQGNRSSQTPEEIMVSIKRYCDRYHYKDKDITPQVARFFLRRMQQEENNRHAHSLVKDPKDRLKRFTDYYKHAPEIAYRLSGIPPPYMTPMQEDRITALFPLVIAAYKTSPRYLTRLQNRTNRIKPVPNNPNYLLVLYKLCQLLGYDEFLPYIPLPKSTDNIDDNDDNAWKWICQTYGWQYIPTR